MPIKNYTSQVPASKSLEYISRKLIDCGAINISQIINPEKKRVEGIVFQLIVKGQSVLFKLPANIDAVEEILKSNLKKPTSTTFENIRKQAERTAWKIISDWVDIQFSMIELAQVEVTQVFLPYVYNPITDKSFYETLKENNFKQLGM